MLHGHPDLGSDSRQACVAPTNKGRLLKVCYVPRGDYFIRTCYEPNEAELAIYRRHGKPHDF